MTFVRDSMKTLVQRIFNVLLSLGAVTSFEACRSLIESASSAQSRVVVWQLAVMNEAASVGLTKSGDPLTVGFVDGKAVQFDGKGDAFFIDTNPLANLRQFTVEVLFRPDPKGETEQRFLHFGDASGDRVLLEIRLTRENQWHLDAFIKSGDSSRTLVDKTLVHPTGAWYHVALVVDNGRMNTYVDGKHALEGAIRFSPFHGGQTSIGVRMNNRYWFKGAIATIRITPRCLTPDQLMRSAPC